MIKIFKKSNALIFSAVLLASCASRKPFPAVISEPKEVAAKDDLLGRQNLEAFTSPPYNEWYTAEYNGYKMDTSALEQLKTVDFSGYEITAFVGTWCEDSHREFPRLIKILKEAGVTENQINIIAVDHNKSSPGEEEVPYDVHKVPTFIIQKNGKEVGRIIEYPKSGFIEKDLLEIVKKG